MMELSGKSKPIDEKSNLLKVVLIHFDTLEPPRSSETAKVYSQVTHRKNIPNNLVKSGPIQLFPLQSVLHYFGQIIPFQKSFPGHHIYVT